MYVHIGENNEMKIMFFLHSKINIAVCHSKVNIYIYSSYIWIRLYIYLYMRWKIMFFYTVK